MQLPPVALSAGMLIAGFTQLSLGQLKIMQKAITLIVFVPFAIFYTGQSVKLDYLWAALCIVGAIYFVFRG
jgi:uncharacterized protein